MSAKPLLSIGIIFKNEIHCIERCVQSLALLREAIPCELVMADTGATDGSREIAEKYADILFDFPWIKDFAAARNSVLERCSGDWFLSIDCDEWIEDAAPLIAYLQSKQEKKSGLITIFIRNYMDLDDKRNFQDALAVRLAYLKNRQVQFCGKIHEYLQCNEKQVVSSVVEFTIHHDGYARQKEKAWETRRARNMELLYEQIRKTPEDLRCLLECVQSAPNEDEMMGYAEQIITVVRKKSVHSEPVQSAAFHEAIAAAYRTERTDLVRQWTQEGKELFPESPFIQIDGNGFLILVEYKQNAWDKCVQYGKEWIAALNLYTSEYNWALLTELAASPLQLNNDTMKMRIYGRLLYGAQQEKDWAFAQEIASYLAELPFVKDDFQIMILTLLSCAGHLDISPCLLAYWNQLLQEDEKSAANEELLQSYLITISEHIKTELVLSAVGDMGACDPARCARALLSNDSAVVQWELNRIENWNHILDPVITHAVTVSAPLPEKFFAQRNDDFSGFASLIADELKEKMSMAVLRYAETQPYEDSLIKLLWLDNLTATALLASDWENESEGLALCRLFARLEKDILSKLYHYEEIQEESLLVLPAIHRFGWRFCKGLEALERGDASVYVRQLKAGVKDVSEMKKTVSFLSEHIDQMRPVVVTPEMQELAEQIQTVLAQYAPDDPAVVALKSSPAYQRVAHILEESYAAEANEISATDSVPVSEPPKRVSQKEKLQLSSAPRVRSAATLDRDFSALLEECGATTVDKLVYRMKRQFQKLPEQARQTYENGLRQLPFVDSFRPKMNDYKFLEEKARSLIEHATDYTWLYDRLEDFRSRKLLYAILRNWCAFDFATLDACIERCFDDYFDLDIMPCVKDEVVVDLGAYTGDTALNFIKAYGKDAYARYYCYEISAGSMEQCKKNTASLHDIFYCQKGVGAEKSVMYLNVNTDPALHSLSVAGDRPINVVSLDEDITEPITFLKMDIEGAEQAAIRGAAKHITNDRPKMALSVYHNNEDLWKIPRMIDELCPDCRFYLRYHGGNAWPTEITFFAVPN